MAIFSFIGGKSFQSILLAQTLLLTPVHSFTVPSNIPHQRDIRTLPMMSSKTSTHNFTGSFKTKKDALMPTMIVFDLDDCLWSPEMYTLRAKPSIPVEGDLNSDPTLRESEREKGTVGMKVPPNGPTVRLFDGARKALREIVFDPKYEGVILAAASSSEEPSYSHACLEGIEVLPGLFLRDMIQYDQIGRTGHLTSRKTTHFRALHEESNVPYNEMLFFDDCNWGDHCADVTANFGVVSQRTPRGMQLSEFHAGIDKYRKEASTSNE